MLRLIFILSIFMLLVVVQEGTRGNGLIEVFKWKQIEYTNCRKQTPSADRPIVFPRNYVRYAAAKRYEAARLYGATWRYEAARRYGAARHCGAKRRRETAKRRFLRATTTNRVQCFDNDNLMYIPYNNVPIGVTHFDGRLFITVPRRREGIPSTLNVIDLRATAKNRSPLLQPYPNPETNQYADKQDGLVSVYRMTVDECQRLWFSDTGNLEYPGNFQQIQPASIWIIDLRKNRRIRRFEIPTTIVGTARGLSSISVDINGGDCQSAYAYIPDLINSKLYVYSFAANRIWSFTHSYFNFDPTAGNVTVAGQNFRWNDGIFSTTIGDVIPLDGSRNVYFHPMQSNNEFYVSNLYLQNEANAANIVHGNAFRLLGSRGMRKQSTKHSYDPKTDVIFYSEVNRNGIGCWNTKKPFTALNHGTVASDDARMIYPSDLSIDENATLWVITNSMPLFVYSTLDSNAFNFRIWKQSAAAAIRNTVCE